MNSESKPKSISKEANINDELEYLKKQVPEERAKAKKALAQLQLISNELKNENQMKDVLELKKNKLQHSLQYYRDICENTQKKYDELENIYTRAEMAVESTNKRISMRMTTENLHHSKEQENLDEVTTQMLQHQLKSLESKTLQHDKILRELVKELNLQ